MTDRYFLDTNVVVYAHDHASPAKQAKAQKLITEGLAGDQLALSAQVLSEFFVVITRKIKVPLSRAKAKEELEIFRFAHVVDISAELVLMAVDLSGSYKISFWDGLIVSAANHAACKILYSEDLSHNQIISGVKIINPFLQKTDDLNKS